MTTSFDARPEPLDERSLLPDGVVLPLRCPWLGRSWLVMPYVQYWRYQAPLV
jgi:hypothetical protein